MMRMMQKTFAFTFLGMVTLWLGVAPGRAEAARRPNILYFYADDLGWGSVGANGQTQIQTPNIDGLAATGVNYIRGYGCPVCSPARSSQQTGFHQGHTWTDRNDPAASKAMREEDPTIGDVLAAAGYRTGYYGKWGYGADQTLVDPAINNPQTLPINHGYDEILAELHHVRAHTFFQPTLWRSNTSDPTPTTALVPNLLPSGPPPFPTYPAHQDDPAYPVPAYCDDAYAFAALDFVRTQAQTPEPFFCLLAFQIPHTPLGEITSLPQWFEAYTNVAESASWPAAAQQFAAMVTRMDAHVGNILAALEDPNQDGDPSDSVLEDTLIIFSSDNGGQGGTPLSFFNANGSLRGAKGTVYEGGIRVPTILKWQGTLPAGATSTRIVDVTDLLPTFAELAGVPAPVGTDGVSLAPSLTGEGVQRAREFLIHEDGGNWSIIRGRYKLTRQSGGLELYDLESDPGEATNLASTLPTLRDELHALALGERVQEDNLFANTHHVWTGPDQGATSDPDHWSDTPSPQSGGGYRRTPRFLECDHGPDRPHLLDRRRRCRYQHAGIRADRPFVNARQILDLGAHALTGRNEIRLSPYATVRLNGGTLSSLRWVDLQENATIAGAGAIEADLYHAGALHILPSSATTVPGPDIVLPGPDITIPDGANIIANGGYETGGDTGGGDYSYASLDDWFTEPELDASKDAAKPSHPHGGTMRGLLQTGPSSNTLYPLIQDTHIPIALGETFDLSFWHRGFSGWETGDTLRIRVFYLDGDSNRVDLVTTTVPATNGVWNQTLLHVPAITDTGAVGRILHLLVAPDVPSETGAEYASIDDVSLIRQGNEITIPGPDITVPGPDILVPGVRRMNVAGAYRGFPDSTLALTLAHADRPGEDLTQLAVTGNANLAGSLAISIDTNLSPEVGDTFSILSAAQVSGRFAHADDMVASGAHHFRIQYTPTHVVLEAMAVTARGTPHWWLIEQGLTGPDFEAEDLRDDDADGMAAWKEYRAGTNPHQFASRLALAIEADSPSGEVSLLWASTSNRLYFLEGSDELMAGFDPKLGPLAASPPKNILSNLLSTSATRFYRVGVQRR